MQSESEKMTIFQFKDYEYPIEYIPSDTNKDELLRLRAYTTTIDYILFANVKCDECDDDNDYVLFKYELTKEDNLLIKTELYKDPLFTSSQELFDFIKDQMNNNEIYDEESH